MQKQTLPLFLGSPKDKAFIDPKDFIQYLKNRGQFKTWEPVKSCILTFNYDWFERIQKRFKLHQKHRHIHIFKAGNHTFVVHNINIGGPKAAMELEDLIALGVQEFIAIGSCGSLQDEIKVGDICLPTCAIRDEGTSYHYQKPSKYAYPDLKLLKKLKKALDQKNFSYFQGPTWTIDAPYRETNRKIKTYQKEGCLSVEMEAASLFSVAKFRKVKLASILNVSDELHGTHWQPKFHHKKHKVSKDKLIDAALEALAFS